VQVDLRHCTYMDSTFLGTLIRLQRTVHGVEDGEFSLVCPSPECRRLFQQMGVEGGFPTIETAECADQAWAEMTCGKDDVPAFQRSVVQAHQELAAVPGRCAETFREVARCLTEEMNAAARP